MKQITEPTTTEEVSMAIAWAMIGILVSIPVGGLVTYAMVYGG
jgi:hypothetical protein